MKPPPQLPPPVDTITRTQSLLSASGLDYGSSEDEAFDEDEVPSSMSEGSQASGTPQQAQKISPSPSPLPERRAKPVSKEPQKRFIKPIHFPPSPPGPPDEKVQSDVVEWVTKIRSGKLQPLNERIQSDYKFLNPYLLSLASEECKINEYSTNFNSSYKRALEELKQPKCSFHALRERQNRQAKNKSKRKRTDSYNNSKPKRSKSDRNLGRYGLPRGFSLNDIGSRSVGDEFRKLLNQNGK